MGPVAGGSGWSVLSEPGRTGREALRVSPFNRLARVHAASAAADVVVAVALAGSLFFSMDPGQARWRVGLYLLLTLAPFAIVAPLIGPLIDRAPVGRWGPGAQPPGTTQEFAKQLLARRATARESEGDGVRGRSPRERLSPPGRAEAAGRTWSPRPPAR